MDRSLDHLSERFRPLAFELLARFVEAGIAVVIVNTLRTQAEQDAAIASGHSWVAHSKHQDGDAIDVCPYSLWQLHGPDKLQWDTCDPVWANMANIARGLGLGCGYDWKQRDAGHFEWVNGA